MEHEELLKEVKSFSEEIDQKYDDFISRMTPEEKDENPDIEKLKERYIELKDKISSARKAGKDVFAADFAIKGFPPKLIMARATQEKEDILKANHALKDASQELEATMAKEAVSIRKEVEDKVKKYSMSSGEEEKNKKKMPEEAQIKETQEEKSKVKEKLQPEASKPEARNKVLKQSIQKTKAPVLYNPYSKNPEECFRVADGKELKSLDELKNYLLLMPDYAFQAHAAKEDFSRWISGVLKDKKIGNMIRDIKDKKEMSDAIEKEMIKKGETG